MVGKITCPFLLYTMITLKALTESIVKQIKPNLTDDVEISEEWIKRIIHDSRAALITKKNGSR